MSQKIEQLAHLKHLEDLNLAEEHRIHEKEKHQKFMDDLMQSASDSLRKENEKKLEQTVSEASEKAEREAREAFYKEHPSMDPKRTSWNKLVSEVNKQIEDSRPSSI